MVCTEGETMAWMISEASAEHFLDDFGPEVAARIESDVFDVDLIEELMHDDQQVLLLAKEYVAWLADEHTSAITEEHEEAYEEARCSVWRFTQGEAWMEVEAGTCRVIRQSGSFPIDLIEVEPKD